MEILPVACTTSALPLLSTLFTVSVPGKSVRLPTGPFSAIISKLPITLMLSAIVTGLEAVR